MQRRVFREGVIDTITYIYIQYSYFNDAELQIFLVVHT